MRYIISIVMCTALFLNGFGQYTYFNQVTGEFGDDASETKTNLEVLNDKFYTWGGGIASSVIYEDIIVFDEDGQIEGEREFPSQDAFVYIGITNSFQRIPGENNFLFSHSLIDANGTHGFLMKVDENLDTLWTRLVDIYPGETYIFTHAWDGDGFILAGEHQAAGVGQGTFIAKVDAEGQYLWHTVLHEPEEGSFRIQTISVIPEGYVLSGSEGGGADTEGQVEYYNSQNENLTTLVNNEPAILRGIMSHHIRDNGDILVTQPIRVIDYPGAVNPQFAYAKSNLYLFDILDLELELLGEYDGGGEWITGGIVKTIESSQEGLVQLGRTYIEIDDSLRQVSFVMKLTEDYQVDWYTQLSYEICSGCVNELYDIEQAPDGGYVMVGKFNSPEDPYDKTWLVKVDACGDLEWQGCEPVGVGELEIEDLKLEIWPNPATDVLRVALPLQETGGQHLKSLSICDITGKVVKEISNSGLDYSDSEIELALNQLEPGLYSLIFSNAKGERLTKNFIKE